MNNDYHPRSTSGRSRSSTTPRRIIFFFSIILVLLGAIFFRIQAQSAFWSIFGSPLKITAAILFKTGSFAAAPFSSKEALQSQNERLAAQVQQLEQKLVDRDELYRENVILKEQLGRPDSQGSLLGAVLSGPPSMPYDTLMIDAGRAQDISAGDLVFVGGEIIGKVGEVGEHTSRVILFSSPGESHQGLLMGSTTGTTPIIVEGDGGGALSAHVPEATELRVGDQIVFPGISGRITEVVAAIDAPQGSSFKTVYMHLPVSISGIQFVEIRRAISN